MTTDEGGVAEVRSISMTANRGSDTIAPCQFVRAEKGASHQIWASWQLLQFWWLAPFCLHAPQPATQPALAPGQRVPPAAGMDRKVTEAIPLATKPGFIGDPLQRPFVRQEREDALVVAVVAKLRVLPLR